MHEERLFRTAETVSRQGGATPSTCQMRAFGYFPFSGNQFRLLSIFQKAFSATFHFPEINFGFLLRHMKQFPEKHIFRKTPQKPTFSAVKSDYAPRYAVCWSKLRSPQNRERTVNTGATKAILN
jgi:hypothetical protein